MSLGKLIERIYSLNGDYQRNKERFYALLDVLDNPQKNYQTVHVVGTNGKGSTCAFLSSILIEGGKKVGVYSSPHLEIFNERIRINHKNISDDNLIAMFDIVLQAADKIKNKHGEVRAFEVFTATAFLWFSEMKVDVAIIEAGMGGVSDITNVIEPSHVAITSISIDHVARLGNSIAEIARDKAGAIKPDVKVIVHPQEYQAYTEIKKIIDKTKAKAAFLQTDDMCVRDMKVNKTVFDAYIEGVRISDVEISLMGRYQIINAISAINVALDMGVGECVIKQGLKKAKWPGRFELFDYRGKKVLIDGAHNEDGARSLVKEIEKYFPEQKKVLICAVSNAKDADSISVEFSKAFNVVIATSVEHTKPASQVMMLFYELGIEVYCAQSPISALDKACGMNAELIVCAGSLYLAGKMRSILQINKIIDG